ncbi:hypothetical protein [Anaerosporomusa subterranea]|jgi:hypothetical protein|uniref:hypothetical protein n=1 Tax=Anaerosporomusa subterranea TaxID=1794912 RepID=UPI0012E8BF91|nr:hypothetical protein [Anaerosporomusa subterranea]
MVKHEANNTFPKMHSTRKRPYAVKPSAKDRFFICHRAGHGLLKIAAVHHLLHNGTIGRPPLGCASMII